MITSKRQAFVTSILLFVVIVADYYIWNIPNLYELYKEITVILLFVFPVIGFFEMGRKRENPDAGKDFDPSAPEPLIAPAVPSPSVAQPKTIASTQPRTVRLRWNHREIREGEIPIENVEVIEEEDSEIQLVRTPSLKVKADEKDAAKPPKVEGQ